VKAEGANFLCLLRGINVGGNRKVEMARLRTVFEDLGYTDVRTFINSGNVIFGSGAKDLPMLTRRIEKGIEDEFGFPVDVVVVGVDRLEQLVEDIPDDWVDDQRMRCYVMFLWPEIDAEAVLDEIPSNPDIEDIRYLPGAVVWRIDRKLVTKSKVTRMVGTDVYKQLSMRSVNTVRKLLALMRPDADSN
jgi:uncharacterized protein (DUF1697 family)